MKLSVAVDHPRQNNPRNTTSLKWHACFCNSKAIDISILMSQYATRPSE